MIEIISDFFINKHFSSSENASRRVYGTVCSLCGVILNLIMFALKLTAGILSGSIAATVDAVHNLTDSASSVVTLLSFILSGKKNEARYPMGLGRIEYLAGFLVALVLLSAGFTLAKASVSKIITPEPVSFSFFSVGMLLLSMLVKLYMAYFNSRTGRKISSVALKAAATDCLCDSFATLIAVLALTAVKFTDANIDAWGGLAVSAFILFAGIKSVKESVPVIIGAAPDKKLISTVKNIALRHSAVKEICRIMLHDYGADNKYISFDIYVSESNDITSISAVLNEIETQIREETGCNTLITPKFTIKNNAD